jgi:DNA polymerase III subunit epsilon
MAKKVAVKEQHRNPRDKNAAINWAKNILENQQNYVILDTETTGLNKNDVIIQIGIIDLEGNILLDTLVRPTKRKRISPEATAIHGISMKDLKDKPTFDELIPEIIRITSGKRALIYNAEYDEKLIHQTMDQDNSSYFLLLTKCVMLEYSKFIGQWNDYYFEYAYQKLPSADHSAIGDCKATLKVIQKMAAEEVTLTETVQIQDSPKPKNMMEIMKSRELIAQNEAYQMPQETKIEITHSNEVYQTPQEVKTDIIIETKLVKKWWEFWK